MQLVDPEITRRKLDREIEHWRESAEVYRRRGWILLDRRDEVVEVAFIGRLPLGPHLVPVISACVRLDYTNYDSGRPRLSSSTRPAASSRRRRCPRSCRPQRARATCCAETIRQGGDPRRRAA